MRTILGFLPALMCAGAMVACIWMMRGRRAPPAEGDGASTSRDMGEASDA